MEKSKYQLPKSDPETEESDHTIGVLKDDDSDPLQTEVMEDGDENFKQFCDGMAKKSLMWQKISMKTIVNDDDRYSDENILKRYRSTIRSLGGKLPTDFTLRSFSIKIVMIFIAPFLFVIGMMLIPSCTPWDEGHVTACKNNDTPCQIDYWSPPECKSTYGSASLYGIIIIAALGCCPSACSVFDKLIFQRYFKRHMRLMEFVVPISFGIVGNVLAATVLFQYWQYPPGLFILTNFIGFPFLVTGFCVMIWVERRYLEGVSMKQLLRSFIYCNLVNCQGFFVNFGTYLAFSIMYNYLQAKRHEFTGFWYFCWLLLSTFGMTALRELNMLERKMLYRRCDPSSIPMGECWVFFIHCTFLSGLRASSAIDGNLIGLVLLSVTDIASVVASVGKIAFRIDIGSMIKKKLGKHWEDEPEDGEVAVEFIIEKSLFLVLEELIEFIVPTVYILTDIVIFYIPNFKLVAGLGVTAFGMQSTKDLSYIVGMMIVLGTELATFLFCQMILQYKCQLNLRTALVGFLHENGTVCCYFGMFAIINMNAIRYVPLGADPYVNFYWLNDISS